LGKNHPLSPTIIKVIKRSLLLKGATPNGIEGNNPPLATHNISYMWRMRTFKHQNMPPFTHFITLTMHSSIPIHPIHFLACDLLKPILWLMRVLLGMGYGEVVVH